MKINNPYFLAAASAILIVFSSSQVHVYADNTTGPMTSSFNHTLTIEKQIRQYYLNDTQTMLAIKLAENSTQFQTTVKGYNYTFSSVYSALGSNPQGVMELMGYDVVFELYKGPVVVGNAIRNLDVSMDPSLTKVFNATSYPAEYTGGSALVNHSSVPEFPFAAQMLVMGLVSLLIFHRVKFKF
ncbi:MAG: hypothetical protein WBF38_06835 [Nitrosotalea sp.]